MFCSVCGKDLSGAVKFCTHCGAAISATAVDGGSVKVPEGRSTPSVPKTRDSTLLAKIFVGLILVVLSSTLLDGPIVAVGVVATCFLIFIVPILKISPRSKWFCVGAAFAMVISAQFASTWNNSLTEKRIQEAKANEAKHNEEAKKEAEERFKALTASEHLNVAKADLVAGAGNAQIAEGMKHLEAISRADALYSEAAALKKSFNEEEQRQREAFANAKTSEAEKALSKGEYLSAQASLSSIGKTDTLEPDVKFRIRQADQKAFKLKLKHDLEVFNEQHPLQVVRSNWQKGGFGTVAIWTVTFKNVSSKPVGNIVYLTQYNSETGDLVDECGEKSFGDKVIRRVIPPKSSRTIEINDCFVHHEAARANFTLKSWEFVRDER